MKEGAIFDYKVSKTIQDLTTDFCNISVVQNTKVSRVAQQRPSVGLAAVGPRVAVMDY